jgi:RimJ/RimL family protein N-acetyltransferase
LSDQSLLLRWANDLQVRSKSFSPELISSYQHSRWLKSGLENPNRFQLIATDSCGCPLGQIRFDRQQTTVNSESREAFIDLSLDRCVRGQRLASVVVCQGLQAMHRRWGLGTVAMADVFIGNQASQSTFARAGFLKDEFIPALAAPVPSLSRNLTRWRWTSDKSSSSAMHEVGLLTTPPADRGFLELGPCAAPDQRPHSDAAKP